MMKQAALLTALTTLVLTGSVYAAACTKNQKLKSGDSCILTGTQGTGAPSATVTIIKGVNSISTTINGDATCSYIVFASQNGMSLLSDMYQPGQPFSPGILSQSTPTTFGADFPSAQSSTSCTLTVKAN